MLILGGAKISTKLPLIYNFLPKADLIFLAGGLANTFLKAKGFEVGKSLVEESEIPKLKSLFNVKIFLPLDFIVQNGKKRYLGEVKKNEKILDIGQETIKTIKLILKNARTIVWNGPLGYVEKRMFRQGTKSLAKFLSQHKGFVLVGGGDTLAFLSEEKLLSKFKNISTGGGAMLHYLANGTLPIFE
jgi:phosphoglycerate kinase